MSPGFVQHGDTDTVSIGGREKELERKQVVITERRSVEPEIIHGDQHSSFKGFEAPNTLLLQAAK